MMMIHRHVDSGKREYPSWNTLQEVDAKYIISAQATESFSSSKNLEFNKAMQKRAMEIIIPR